MKKFKVVISWIVDAGTDYDPIYAETPDQAEQIALAMLKDRHSRFRGNAGHPSMFDKFHEVTWINGSNTMEEEMEESVVTICGVVFMGWKAKAVFIAFLATVFGLGFWAGRSL